MSIRTSTKPTWWAEDDIAGLIVNLIKAGFPRPTRDDVQGIAEDTRPELRELDNQRANEIADLTATAPVTAHTPDGAVVILGYVVPGLYGQWQALRDDFIPVGRYKTRATAQRKAVGSFRPRNTAEQVIKNRWEHQEVDATPHRDTHPTDLPFPAAARVMEPVVVANLTIGYVEHVGVSLWYAWGADGQNLCKLTNTDEDHGGQDAWIGGPWKRYGLYGAFTRKEDALDLVHECYPSIDNPDMTRAHAIGVYEDTEKSYVRCYQEWQEARANGTLEQIEEAVHYVDFYFEELMKAGQALAELDQQ